MLIIYCNLGCKCINDIFIILPLEAITALTGAIPDDMIIDSSLVDVSTIIGQGMNNYYKCLNFRIHVIIFYFAGEFGVVYKGMLKKGRANEVVAVKSLKGTCVCV